MDTCVQCGKPIDLLSRNYLVLYRRNPDPSRTFHEQCFCLWLQDNPIDDDYFDLEE